MNDVLVEQLKEIAGKFPGIESVLLFGSRAHGDFTPLSDIDLAVKAPKLSEMEWLTFAEQVEDGLDTLLKIDLVIYDRSSLALREQIDQCYRILYRNCAE